MRCATRRSRRRWTAGPTADWPWSPSGATGAVSSRRTRISTWSWSTTTPATSASSESTLWYPLWDSGMQLDHSVRALSEVIGTAEGDIRVAMGLLDARHVAGDPSITLRLRADILAHWRRDARRNLPDVRKLVEARAAALRRARPRIRSRTSRSPTAACATPPSSPTWSPAGSSTCPTSTCSAPAWPSWTPGTWCSRSTAVPATGSRPTPGMRWPPPWSYPTSRRRSATSAASGGGSRTSPGSPGAGSTRCCRASRGCTSVARS